MNKLWLFINEFCGAIFRKFGLRRYWPFWTQYDLEEAKKSTINILELFERDSEDVSNEEEYS